MVRTRVRVKARESCKTVEEESQWRGDVGVGRGRDIQLPHM